MLHVDGRYHHQKERFERDARQRARLSVLGWRQLVVTRKSFDDGSWLTALTPLLERTAPQLTLPLAAVPADW